MLALAIFLLLVLAGALAGALTPLGARAFLAGLLPLPAMVVREEGAGGGEGAAELPGGEVC